jgi:multidrug efflux pump subunit AcrA (membrane-fusion protein)
MRHLPIAAIVLLCLTGPAHGAAGLDPLTLTQTQTAAGGIATEALQAIRQSPELTAFGQVLDPGQVAAAAAQLATKRAEIEAAQAKLRLAQTAATRAAHLFRAQRNISEAQYESAEASALVARANVDVANAKLHAGLASVRAEWGPTLAMAITKGAAPIPALESGAACLMQVTLPFGAALASVPDRAKGLSPSGSTLRVRLIAPSPRSHQGSGPSFFYLGTGRACPPVGMTIAVRLATGPAQEGVIVPASAVVWRAGQPIAYRAEGKARFVPVPLASAVPLGGGYFVPNGGTAVLRPTQRIVVHGAALLLSESLAPAEAQPSAGGDDDD